MTVILAQLTPSAPVRTASMAPALSAPMTKMECTATSNSASMTKIVCLIPVLRVPANLVQVFNRELTVMELLALLILTVTQIHV